MCGFLFLFHLRYGFDYVNLTPADYREEEVSFRIACI
jgi:hypothetical protein